MNFLKNLWAKLAGSIQSIGQYLGLLKQIKTLKDTFPGIENENELRTWVFDQANNFEPFALKTANTIDDKLIVSVRGIAYNEKAFSAIYNLLRLGFELIPVDEPTYGNAYVSGVYDVVMAVMEKDDGNPKDILTIMAAIGLLIQVIRLLRERNARS